MLFLSDNLAYFPYQVQDEPLFIVHHIDIMISVSGTNLLQSFREVRLNIQQSDKYILNYKWVSINITPVCHIFHIISNLQLG